MNQITVVSMRTVRESRDAFGFEADEPVEPPDREQQAARASKGGEDNTLGQELPEQAQSAGAERAPHGHLALTYSGPSEQQVCDVGAGDEEHEPDGTEQHQHGASNVADDCLVQRPRREIESFVAIGILAGQLLADCLHLGDHLFDRHARLRSSDDIQVPRPSLRRGEIFGLFERHPDDAAGGIRKTFRHDSHDLCRHAIEGDHLADGPARTAESLLPQSIRQHRDLGVARLALVRIEPASDGRRDAEQVEKAGTDLGAVEPHRFTPASQNHS